MATNKNNEFPVIDNKKPHIALRAFTENFKKHEEEYLERGVNVGDVKSLIETFEGKASLTAMSTVIVVIAALPVGTFLAFSKTFKEIQKVKMLEAFMSKFENKETNGADNDIDN